MGLPIQTNKVRFEPEVAIRVLGRNNHRLNDNLLLTKFQKKGHIRENYIVSRFDFLLRNTRSRRKLFRLPVLCKFIQFNEETVLDMANSSACIHRRAMF